MSATSAGQESRCCFTCRTAPLFSGLFVVTDCVCLNACLLLRLCVCAVCVPAPYNRTLGKLLSFRPSSFLSVVAIPSPPAVFHVLDRFSCLTVRVLLLFPSSSLCFVFFLLFSVLFLFSQAPLIPLFFVVLSVVRLRWVLDGRLMGIAAAHAMKVHVTRATWMSSYSHGLALARFPCLSADCGRPSPSFPSLLAMLFLFAAGSSLFFCFSLWRFATRAPCWWLFT